MLHSLWFLQKYLVLGSAAAKRISTPEHRECPQFPGSQKGYLENNPMASKELKKGTNMLVNTIGGQQGGTAPRRTMCPVSR